MNCKPGDLAVIVRARSNPAWIGRIVSVIAWVPGVDGWLTEPMPPTYLAVCDSVLRPIRDPGDDATDETLLWLPVPSKEVA